MLKVHSNADCKFLSDDRVFLPSHKTAAFVRFGHGGKTTKAHMILKSPKMSHFGHLKDDCLEKYSA